MFVLLYKYVIFALFMLNITPFQANVLFPYPLKTSGLKWVNYLFFVWIMWYLFFVNNNKFTITIMMIKIINVKNFVESYFLREFNQQFSK